MNEVIDGHHLGLKELAIIQSRKVATYQSTVLNGDAFRTKVSGHFRQGGCTLDKRGSTVGWFVENLKIAF